MTAPRGCARKGCKWLVQGPELAERVSGGGALLGGGAGSLAACNVGAKSCSPLG